MICRITKVRDEARDVKTFFIDRSFDPAPGQFAMVWVIGFDEIPLSFSYQNGFTVRKVGDATSAMFELQKGDLIGVRGPFGRGFTLNKGSSAIIGGGIGAAPLAFLSEKLSGRVVTYLGAKCRDELVFLRRFRRRGEVKVATEDGSLGLKGKITELLGDELKEFSRIYVCGPEKMMAEVVRICRDMKILSRVQLSVDRYMKCGIGVCGSCDLGGLRVCADGPVFDGKQLAATEFGKWRRDECGGRIKI